VIIAIVMIVIGVIVTHDLIVLEMFILVITSCLTLTDLNVNSTTITTKNIPNKN